MTNRYTPPGPSRRSGGRRRVTTASAVPPLAVAKMTKAACRKTLDRQAQRLLNISGREFVLEYEGGAYDETQWENANVSQLISLYLLATS